MHPDWARQLHDDCQAHGIAVFFKQVGDWAWTDSATCSVETEGLMLDGRRVQFGMPNSQGIAKTGAKAAGQRLDGRLIQEFP
jgi:protein gp37